MAKGYHEREGLTTEDLGLSLDDLRGEPLELLVREGARLLLSIALEEEITEFLGRRRYERIPGRGYRNGHRERQVTCSAGELSIPVPRVADAPDTFRSSLLGAWQRRSRLVEEVLPLLYIEGLSTRDFRRALAPLWGKSGLSRSSISRANRVLKGAFQAWRQRELSGEEIVYLFLDGFYLGVRQASREKEGVLIAHAIDTQGKRSVLHLSLGGRESTQAWKTALHDLIERGLRSPQLVISDGNPGLLRAVSEVWPEVPQQRCVVHRIRNVLARVPRSRHAEVKRALHGIFYAGSLGEARALAERFFAGFRREFPSACELLERHLGECLTFYRYPEAHWKYLRSTNILERAFREVRRRTQVVGRFPDEMAALELIFGVLEEKRLKWHRLNLQPEDVADIERAVKSLDEEPVWIELGKAASA